MKFTFLGEQMLRVLKRAKVFTETKIVKFTVLDYELAVQTQAEEIGDFLDFVPIKKDPDATPGEYVFAVNIDFFAGLMVSDDGIHFFENGDNLPIKLTAPGIPGWTGVIMPMHLDGGHGVPYKPETTVETPAETEEPVAETKPKKQKKAKPETVETEPEYEPVADLEEAVSEAFDAVMAEMTSETGEAPF